MLVLELFINLAVNTIVIDNKQTDGHMSDSNWVPIRHSLLSIVYIYDLILRLVLINF